MIYLAAAIACIWILIAHLRRPIPLFPESWLGKGQFFYLVFLWTVVTFNFIHVLPRFTEQRLVTEWFMTLNAIFCTVFVLLAGPRRDQRMALITPHVSAGMPEPQRAANVSERAPAYATWIRRAAILGVIGTVAITFAGWGVKRALFGDGSVDPKQKPQIRFGPNNTDTIK